MHVACPSTMDGFQQAGNQHSHALSAAYAALNASCHFRLIFKTSFPCIHHAAEGQGRYALLGKWLCAVMKVPAYQCIDRYLAGTHERTRQV